MKRKILLVSSSLGIAFMLAVGVIIVGQLIVNAQGLELSDQISAQAILGNSISYQGHLMDGGTQPMALSILSLNFTII